MLTVTSTSHSLKTTKGALVFASFIFVFLVASVAIGFKASNAFVPTTRGCGGGDGEGVSTCTTTSTVRQTSVTSTDTSITTTVSTDQTTSSVDNQPQTPVTTPPQPICTPLDGISYQVLSAGAQLTIAFNGNGQMIFTVPSQSFTWNWYWIPADGQNLNSLGQQITSSLWASGHGQNFSFFIASLNGQSGIVLQTDYALSQACS